MNKNIVWIIVLVVVAAGSYYMGSKSVPAPVAQGQGQNGGRQFGGRTGGNGGGVAGDVLSKDVQSLTVKMRDGSSKIVFYSGSTQIMKQASGTIADINVGTTITVGGTPNSDGSVTANTIQIRPAGFNDNFRRGSTTPPQGQ